MKFSFFWLLRRRPEGALLHHLVHVLLLDIQMLLPTKLQLLPQLLLLQLPLQRRKTRALRA